VLDLDLAGRSGVITGASAGIGRGIALALGTQGVRLTLHGRSSDRLAALAKQIAEAGGPVPNVVAHDLTADDAVDAIVAASGDADIVVNNAGGGRALDRSATEAQWDEAFTLNFTRHRQLTQRLVPAMIEAGWGRIVNITGKSESAKGVNGAHIAKAAMHAWAKGMSRDVGRNGVTVNCIAPGKINSDQIMRRYSAAEREREAREDIPVGYYGEPADIAHLVTFLVSPLARYITGTVIPVDGGLRRYQF
jgi:3-oxoacyl-[acyl-carrier protein] reductase